MAKSGRVARFIEPMECLPVGEKPRLIQITIKPAGHVPFRIGDTQRKAIDYVLHVELGGVAGVVAPLIGKQPSDFHIWILGGAAPAFIREAAV